LHLTFFIGDSKLRSYPSLKPSSRSLGCEIWNLCPVENIVGCKKELQGSSALSLLQKIFYHANIKEPGVIRAQKVAFRIPPDVVNREQGLERLLIIVLKTEVIGISRDILLCLIGDEILRINKRPTSIESEMIDGDSLEVYLESLTPLLSLLTNVKT
jgi:hypothetical protein